MTYQAIEIEIKERDQYIAEQKEAALLKDSRKDIDVPEEQPKPPISLQLHPYSMEEYKRSE